MRHLVIPDCQVKPGIDVTYLKRIGTFITEKKPEKIICLGDFADMASLSSYSKGKKSFEGQRYVKDIEAAKSAMSLLLSPLQEYNAKAKKNKEKLYKPKLILTLGNHENRITRAVEDNAQLEGLISEKDLGYESFGWEVHPFLDIIVVDGVAYSHYFVTGVAGRPASTAAAQLRKTNMSSIAGHQQGKQIAYATRADGSTITSIITGSCYLHDEDYMGPQGNRHWRGLLVLNDVKDGTFDEMWLSLDYINKRYAD